VVIATSLCADHTEDEASPSRCSLPSDKVVCPRLYGIGGDGRGSRPLRRRSRALDRVLKSIRGRIDGQYWAQSLSSAMHKPVTTSRLCSIAVCPLLTPFIVVGKRDISAGLASTLYATLTRRSSLVLSVFCCRNRFCGGRLSSHKHRDCYRHRSLKSACSNKIYHLARSWSGLLAASRSASTKAATFVGCLNDTTSTDDHGIVKHSLSVEQSRLDIRIRSASTRPKTAIVGHDQRRAFSIDQHVERPLAAIEVVMSIIL